MSGLVLREVLQARAVPSRGRRGSGGGPEQGFFFFVNTLRFALFFSALEPKYNTRITANKINKKSTYGEKAPS